MDDAKLMVALQPLKAKGHYSDAKILPSQHQPARTDTRFLV